MRLLLAGLVLRGIALLCCAGWLLASCYTTDLPGGYPNTTGMMLDWLLAVGSLTSFWWLAWISDAAGELLRR